MTDSVDAPAKRQPRAAPVRGPVSRTYLGWSAAAASLGMYFSYIDQISRNLAGHHGSALLSAATVLNCTLWLSYGLRSPRDWPIVVSNIPGVLLAFLAWITALQ